MFRLSVLILLLAVSVFTTVSAEELDVRLYRIMLSNVKTPQEACEILELIPDEEGIGSHNYRCNPDVTVVQWRKWLQKASTLSNAEDILNLMTSFELKPKSASAGLVAAFSGVQHLIAAASKNVHQSVHKASCLVTGSDECRILEDPVLKAINELSPELAVSSLHSRYVRFYAQIYVGMHTLFNHGNGTAKEAIWSGFSIICESMDISPVMVILVVFLLTTRIIWVVDYQFVILYIVGLADHTCESITNCIGRKLDDLHEWFSDHHVNQYNGVDAMLIVTSYAVYHLSIMNLPQYILLLCTILFIRRTYSRETWDWKQMMAISWSLLVCFYSTIRTTTDLGIDDLCHHVGILTAMSFVTAITTYIQVVGNKLMLAAVEHALNPLTKDSEMHYTPGIKDQILGIVSGVTGYDLIKILLAVASMLLISPLLLIAFIFSIITGTTMAYYSFKLYLAPGCINLGIQTINSPASRTNAKEKLISRHRLLRRTGIALVIALSLHPWCGLSTSLAVAGLTTLTPIVLKLDSLVSTLAFLCVGSSKATHLAPILMVFNLSDQDVTVPEAPV